MRAVLIALALLAAGCAGSDTMKTAKPYGPDDRRWLHRLETWQTEYWENSQDVSPAWSDLMSGGQDIDRLRAALAAYRGCQTTLGSKVGRPHHERLRGAYEKLVEVCEQDRDYALALVESFETNEDPGLPQVDATIRSEDISAEAYRIIEAGLRVNQPLPTKGGVSSASRIEPRLSRAASRFVERRVQVRCWSRADWPPTLNEWNSYSGNESDLAGLATGDSRAHIEQEYCDTFAQFLYGGWRPANIDGLADLADAVGLLAHEAQHLLNSAADEAETECHAAQSVRRTARLLGASKLYADRLQRIYWTEIYRYQDEEYISSRCRNDGLYDERPETDVFP